MKDWRAHLCVEQYIFHKRPDTVGEMFLNTGKPYTTEATPNQSFRKLPLQLIRQRYLVVYDKKNPRSTAGVIINIIQLEENATTHF
jgi:hypothetical protein